MKIKIVLYGVLKNIAKAEELECAIAQADPTVDDVYAAFAKAVGIPIEDLAEVAAAVGDELVERGYPLRSGEVVMLLPHVSGG